MHDVYGNVRINDSIIASCSSGNENNKVLLHILKIFYEFIFRSIGSDVFLKCLLRKYLPWCYMRTGRQGRMNGDPVVSFTAPLGESARLRSCVVAGDQGSVRPSLN